MANVDHPDKTRRLAHAASSGRSVICKVLLLDGSAYDIDVDKKAIGLVLFDKVCEHLDLLEKDYFGLNFIDSRTNLTSWLNLDKKISKQMKDAAWHFNFEIKFYPTDVHQLHEDLTRYQLCLQIRRDAVSEKLPCSFVTYSLLGSYTVQSELGDWEMEEFGPGIDYIKGMSFAPNQDRDLLKKIVELHKTHRGQTPEEAELHFLDNAKKLSLYGVYLHDAKDGEGLDIQIGICAGGIMIYKDKLQISRFVWPKVVKMSYRRNKFYIKLRPGEFEDFQSMIAFKLLSIKHAKRIWKIAVEHHSFFRFREAEMPRKRGFLKLGSKFRYSGRTLYQSKVMVSAVDRPMPNFDRIHSKRATYGGRPNKRHHDVDADYYSRPVRDTRPPSRPPKSDVPQDNYISRNPEDEAPPVNRDRQDHEDEDEDPIETKHRMERMHAVPTPLALMNQTKDKEPENNNGQPQHMDSGDDHTPEPRRRRDEYRPPSEDEMERPIDIPLNHAPPHIEPAQDTPFRLLSKEEQKRQQKEEKEKIKRAKDEEKRRKKEEEKERKRIEKERKSKKGKEKIGQEWDHAVTTAARTEVSLPPRDESPDRSVKRMSSFEEKRVSSLQEEHLSSEGDPNDVPSDKETEAADDNDDHSENEQVNQSRVGEEFEL